MADNDQVIGRARISAILVSYRTGSVLLESLGALADDPDVSEIVLIDNGNSTEDRLVFYEALKKTDKGRLFQGHGNIGFAAACNYGATVAQGRFLHFLNPDAVIESGASRTLKDVGSKYEIPWLAGGLLLDAHGNEQAGARRGALTFSSAFLGFTGLDRLLGKTSVYRHTEPMPEAATAMPTVSGANFMIDRASFDRVGKLDEGYFLHVEDIALCRAVRRSGGTVIFVPNARALHHGSTSDASPWIVERHKLKGLLRYFWTCGAGLGSKLATIVLAPLIASALMARLILHQIRR